MRTAIVSDLHLGLASGGDVLRHPAVQDVLIDEIAGADRLVLLGDIVELREQPAGRALACARPFFERLGTALAGREIVFVPGNHDHRLAEPLLDALELSGLSLELEHQTDPSPSLTAEIAALLGSARVRIAYPGLWLRKDVYATHGHYIDTHLRLPRAECLAVAILARIRGPLPAAATPTDYERLLRPLYGFAYAVAQGRRRPIGHQQLAAEAAWEVLAGERREGLKGRAARASFPWAIRGLNSLLRSDFEADVTPAAIFHSGREAGIEMARRLGVDDVQVITGHTHRAGPLPGEPGWSLPLGGALHNTGSWVFSSAFHQPGTPPNSYWPGTVTWLEEDGPPRRVQLLRDYSHAAMSDLISRSRATRR
jgi:predicted phosphodiesterase